MVKLLTMHNKPGPPEPDHDGTVGNHGRLEAMKADPLRGKHFLLPVLLVIRGEGSGEAVA